MFKNLEILDSIHLNFSPAGLVIMNLTLAFIMFGIALILITGNSAKLSPIPGHSLQE